MKFMIHGTIAIATTALAFSAAMARGQEAPAEAIVDKMAGVTDELGRKETGKPVQTEQKTIVRDLDELIASLEKRRRANQAGIKNNNPNAGMRESRISSGRGGIGNLADPAESGKEWAKLSGRERDRILQSMAEGFPPEYRTVLERYYRRLAEEKAGPAADAEPKTTSKPSADEAFDAEAPAEAAPQANKAADGAR